MILGPRSIEHLTDQLATAELRLDDQTLDSLDEIAASYFSPVG